MIGDDSIWDSFPAGVTENKYSPKFSAENKYSVLPQYLFPGKYVLPLGKKYSPGAH